MLPLSLRGALLPVALGVVCPVVGMCMMYSIHAAGCLKSLNSEETLVIGQAGVRGHPWRTYPTFGSMVTAGYWQELQYR